MRPTSPMSHPLQRRRLRALPAVLLSLSLMAATPVAAAPHPTPAADASVITTWNEIAVATITAAGPSPTAFNYLAFVHLAMYNTVAGITGSTSCTSGPPPRRSRRRPSVPPPPPRTASS